ncbi:MAG: AbrB family transcriptional regulator [Pelosinus sp.]|nr:AbrB family transcriptional regulator [Pelosinus sp.]
MYYIVKTFFIAVIGGFLFQTLHTPLPWTLGPLAAMIFWNIKGIGKIHWSVAIRNTGLVALGYTMGSPFTAETGRQIVEQLPSMMVATFFTILMSMLFGYITYRQTNISLESSLIGSIPGGLAQMVVLAEEIPNADLGVVTFMQTVRLLSVVFVVPFLVLHGLAGGVEETVSASQVNGLSGQLPIISLFLLVNIMGAFAAKKISLPTPFMLGPVLCTAGMVLAGIAAPRLPIELINIAQLCVGTYMGISIKKESLSRCTVILPYVFLGALGVLVCSMLVGWVLAFLHPITLITGFLSTSPGGMNEMGLTAMMVHADISMVIAYQIFRLLFILLFIPPILRWVLCRNKPVCQVIEE